MTYFKHHYASNSDLKELVARDDGRQKPENIQELYDFGTEFHAGILEPHNANLSMISTEQVELIKDMAKTFWKDEMCRNIAMMSDFKREHEFYRHKRFGIGARCKCDGKSSKLRVILELKGLSVTTEKAFRDSLLHLDYDQGAAWYLNVASSEYLSYRHKLIVGISKKNPDLLFKMLIGRNHPYYKSGMKKVIKAVKLWKSYGFE